jgi:acyl carrier protein
MRAGPAAVTLNEDELRQRKKFQGLVARSLDLNPKDIQMSSQIFGELGSESLDLLDLTFSIEMEFRIRMPRTDLLLRAAEFFGDEQVMKDGVITDLGLEIIGRCMPEIDRVDLRPGLTVTGFRNLIRVDSLYRLVCRLIDLKRELVCPVCSGHLADSATNPELICSQCGHTVPFPSGENLLMVDLQDLAKELGVSPR